MLARLCAPALADLGLAGSIAPACARRFSAVPPADEVAKSSPTGRLLDLFASPDTLTPPTSSGPASSGPAAAGERREGQRAAKQDATDADRDVVQIMLQAVENCKPLMKVQSIKTGTRVIHVPKVVMPREQRSLAMRWIIAAAHQRKEASKRSTMAECLALELLLAYRKEGSARQKRDDLHKLALDNKSNVAGFSLK